MHDRTRQALLYDGGYAVAMTFAAIDVETANRRPGSICALGVVLVRDGRVVTVEHLLARPPAELSTFERANTRVHGISAATVAGEPTFADQLARVLELVADQPVVGHNIAFDMRAIREACDADRLPWPTMKYSCTLTLARRAGLGLLSYRLPAVCEALQLSVGAHHHAASDAEAAARVVLALAAQQGVHTLEELSGALGVRLGRISESRWVGCIADVVAAHGQDHLPGIDRRHPLYGKHIAFTGGLSSPRSEVSALVASLGALPQVNPTKATDYLVIGDGFTGTSAEDFHTGRAAKAVRVNAKGGHIEVLTEGDLLDLLAERTTDGVRGGWAA